MGRSLHVLTCHLALMNVSNMLPGRDQLLSYVKLQGCAGGHVLARSLLTLTCPQSPTTEGISRPSHLTNDDINEF